MDESSQAFLSALRNLTRDYLPKAPVPPEIKKRIDPQDEKHKARKRWGWLLAGLIVFQLAFMDFILVAVGLGWFDLGQPILGVFVTGVFGQVAGFVYIVLRYYFQD